MLVDNKLGMSQHCTLAAKKAISFLACVRKSIASSSIPLCSALMRYIWSAVSTAGLPRTSRMWTRWSSCRKVKLFYCEGDWTRNKLSREVWNLHPGDIQNLTGHCPRQPASVVRLWAGGWTTSGQSRDSLQSQCFCVSMFLWLFLSVSPVQMWERVVNILPPELFRSGLLFCCFIHLVLIQF